MNGTPNSEGLSLFNFKGQYECSMGVDPVIGSKPNRSPA